MENLNSLPLFQQYLVASLFTHSHHFTTTSAGCTLETITLAYNDYLAQKKVDAPGSVERMLENLKDYSIVSKTKVSNVFYY